MTTRFLHTSTAHADGSVHWLNKLASEHGCRFVRVRFNPRERPIVVGWFEGPALFSNEAEARIAKFRQAIKRLGVLYVEIPDKKP